MLASAWFYTTSMRTFPGMMEQQTFQQGYPVVSKQQKTNCEPSSVVQQIVEEDAEERSLTELMAAFPGLSLEVIAAAYNDADCDVNAAAEKLATREEEEHHHHQQHVTEPPPLFQNLRVKKKPAAEETGCEDLLVQKYGSGVRNFRGRVTDIIRQQPDRVVGYHISRTPGLESPRGKISSSNNNTFDQYYSSVVPQQNLVGIGGKKSSPPSSSGIESSSASLPRLKLPPTNVSDNKIINPGLYDDDYASHTNKISNRSTGTGGRYDDDDDEDGRSSVKEFNEVSGNETLLHLKKSKKKKGDGTNVAELLEPKDAVQRRAAAEFLHSTLEEGFRLGIDVVKDTMGHFQGDTQKSLDTLLQIGLPSSGLSLTSENSKLLSESPSQLDGKKAFVPDPLHTLMEAFPDKDPAQVVMAFQEYKGDVELASSMLLKVGNLPTDRSFQQESTTNQMLDNEHSRTRALLNRLKINFPTVDNTSLFEVLQSNNFSYRETVQTLMDAGLTPVHGKANHMDTSDPPQTVLQNLHNDNASAKISACAQPLPAVWRDRGPVESAQIDLMESAKNVPDGTATKKNPVHHFKSYGELDDYDRLRRSANEHWRTMQYYFNEAAAAYGRGERCRAASLSEKGKEYKQLAREASERASYRIFDSKNKDIENNITIDLHAQHVREAIQVLKLHLQTLSSVPSVHTLTVITGHGSHSSNGRAKIKPAVIRFLLKREIPWREGNIGCLIIKMKDVWNKDLDPIDPDSPTEYENK